MMKEEKARNLLAPQSAQPEVPAAEATA